MHSLFSTILRPPTKASTPSSQTSPKSQTGLVSRRHRLLGSSQCSRTFHIYQTLSHLSTVKKSPSLEWFSHLNLEPRKSVRFPNKRALAITQRKRSQSRQFLTSRHSLLAGRLQPRARTQGLPLQGDSSQAIGGICLVPLWVTRGP